MRPSGHALRLGDRPGAGSSERGTTASQLTARAWQSHPVAPPRWFAVRCVFRLDGLANVEGTATNLYEERITIWRAGTFDEAIALAEEDATDYAQTLAPNEYLGLAQAYEMADSLEHGAEVFSLLRESPLQPGEYLDAFFDTGSERQSRDE